MLLLYSLLGKVIDDEADLPCEDCEMRKRKMQRIEYEIPEEQGVAVLFAGAKLNGMTLKQLTRKGRKVVIIYEDDEVKNGKDSDKHR